MAPLISPDLTKADDNKQAASSPYPPQPSDEVGTLSHLMESCHQPAKDSTSCSILFYWLKLFL